MSFYSPSLRFWVVLAGLSWGAVFVPASFTAEGEKQQEEPFRPEAGKFPPLEKAHAYRGELVFVDHANRRGSIRVQGSGVFRRNDPHPFALLPYAHVRYQGAPADLRDIPLGTVLHVRAYLPPDPKTSSVPVLPVNSKDIDANHYRGVGIFPAENHVILLEDEPSHCLRQGLVWRLGELEIRGREGIITARRGSRTDAGDEAQTEKLTFDATTRVWRGRECLDIDDLIAEGLWPREGKKSLEQQAVYLGITWKPTPDGIFTRFHLSDLWLDEPAMENATMRQTEGHKAFIRARWLPAWIDAVEYGQFGRATISATLFGGMDPSLYSDFQTGTAALMNGVENTLKHTEGGTAGPTQMAARGKLTEVVRAEGGIPLGSSGIRIRFETDLITEGLRPGRIVRVRPASWPDVHLPREEYIGDGGSNVEERFPTPDIFPKY